MLGEILGGLLSSLLGWAPRRWGMPRARVHADGSVTVPGLIHGFTSIDSHHGWIGGYLTISDQQVVHTIDRDVKVLRRTVPRAGATVEIQSAHGADWVVIGLVTPDGRHFKISFDRMHDQALAQFS
ncbi:hypothetical protein [Planotetraspora kaengkrachanensis]|uniref:Uncharacterized protein n=1 Tax=Planotetraspora kaengkrachanensis TaxID=575193 RepID=A0A8J3M261_9ACTN|nr:hypothetical protein [Planotetraspora kaengkrachanensis]GIG77695.1 hypothetical protein Pka01_08220 [Planotetraspora kaengkrachanensis]